MAKNAYAKSKNEQLIQKLSRHIIVPGAKKNKIGDVDVKKKGNVWRAGDAFSLARKRDAQCFRRLATSANARLDFGLLRWAAHDK